MGLRRDAPFREQGGQRSGRMPDTIPLKGQNCPAWRQNTVRHASGMLSAIIPESCPSWAGTRSYCVARD